MYILWKGILTVKVLGRVYILVDNLISVRLFWVNPGCLCGWAMDSHWQVYDEHVLYIWWSHQPINPVLLCTLGTCILFMIAYQTYTVKIVGTTTVITYPQCDIKMDTVMSPIPLWCHNVYLQLMSINEYLRHIVR